jgi:tetratricopeptide (TPR) repeat protein
MSETGKAVFLSYASQDAEAVRRICDALRAAGVEVWFDQNELRGGDAWDQKIRRQIKECALFVPIISAQTQARPEGYFRLEWKLAVDRSHLMSEDHPFLFPIVIDDIPETLARVPDRFRDVQWTRLTLRDTPESLATRVARLLDHASDGETSRSAPPGGGSTTRAGDRWIGRAAVIFGLACAAFFLLRPFWVRRDQPTKVPAATSAAPEPTSKASQLVTQARRLYEPWDFATNDDFKLAERLLREATELEPQHADGWAALAIVSYALNIFGFDRTDARNLVLQTAADRAIKLAPDSDLARLALALRHRHVPGMDDEAIELLEAFVQRRPSDGFVLRQLGAALAARERHAEALAIFQRAAALPGGDPIARVAQARSLQRLRRVDEAEAALAEALRLRPTYGYAHIIKLSLLLYERGDLERTKQALRQIPTRVMSDERVASVAAFMWYYARDEEAAGNALRYISRDYVESNVATLPKGYVAGLVHRQAGREDAAVLEWQQALRVVERRLQTNPTSANDIGDKAALLALLGQTAPAADALRMYEQLRRDQVGRPTLATWTVYADLGRADEVAGFFDEVLRRASTDGVPTHVAMFRFHPALDRFRDQPRFLALAREADRLLTPK